MTKNLAILIAVIAIATLASCSKLKEEEFYGDYPDDAVTQTDNESQESVNDNDQIDPADSDTADSDTSDTTDSETIEPTDKDEPGEQTDENNSTDEENPLTDEEDPVIDDDNPITDDNQENDNDNQATDDDQENDSDNQAADDDQETDDDNQAADDDQETDDDNQAADDDQENDNDNQPADDDNPITDDDPVIPGCTPDCNGKECGHDGCGGICKTDCGTDAACNAEQTMCVPYTCKKTTVNKLRERDTLPMGEHRDKYIYKATYTDSNNATSSDEDFKFQINYDESLPAVVDLSNFQKYNDCLYGTGGKVCLFIQNYDNGKLYFQQSGTVDISSLNTSNGNISAVLGTVRLVETGFISYNTTTYEIPGGECLEINNETLNYTAPVYSAK